MPLMTAFETAAVLAGTKGLTDAVVGNGLELSQRQVALAAVILSQGYCLALHVCRDLERPYGLIVTVDANVHLTQFVLIVADPDVPEAQRFDPARAAQMTCLANAWMQDALQRAREFRVVTQPS